MYEFRVPDLGEGLTTATIVAWHVSAGDAIEVDDPLVELETDKAVLTVPSPVGGVVRQLLAQPGSEVAVGALIASVETASHGSEAARRSEVRAAPRTRALAARLGVDLGALGHGGEIVREQDVLAAAEPGQTNGRVSDRGKARAVTVVEEADVTELAAARRHSGVTCFVRAVVGALGSYPELNATFDGERPLRRDSYDIGIAVQTERGLVTPVMRDVGGRSLGAIDAELTRLRTGARSGTLAPGSYRDATLSITSAGAFGGIMATPLIVQPQVATLGLYRVMDRPAVIDGAICARKLVYVSCTFDHRAVEGHRAAGLLVTVARLLADPVALGVGAAADSERDAPST